MHARSKQMHRMKQPLTLAYKKPVSLCLSAVKHITANPSDPETSEEDGPEETEEATYEWQEPDVTEHRAQTTAPVWCRGRLKERVVFWETFSKNKLALTSYATDTRSSGVRVADHQDPSRNQT